MRMISREFDEGLRIGDHVEIKILDLFAIGNSVQRQSRAASIGIQALRETRVPRKALLDTPRGNQAASFL